MESIIINSVKVILCVVAGVAVGKIASGFIIDLNAGGTNRYDTNKKKI